MIVNNLMLKRLGDLAIGDRFFLKEPRNGNRPTEYEFRGVIPFSIHCKAIYRQNGFEKYAEIDKNKSVYVRA